MSTSIKKFLTAMKSKKLHPPEITAKMAKDADNQIRQRQEEVKYDTRDFVIGWMVNEFEAGSFYVPDYQREFIWTNEIQCRFIESVLLGLPIPMLFFADRKDGRLEIVDGAQRMQTLVGFLKGNIELKKLKRLDKLNHFRFADLPKAHQSKLRSRALRCVVLADGTSDETRQEIFSRINTSGVKAKGAEIRRGAHQGPFSTFITTCANDSLFKVLCPLSAQQLKHRENEELVLRFFTYSDKYMDFRHDVRSFLDGYLIDHSLTFDEARLKKEFLRTLQSVETHLPYGFRKSPNARTTPRVRFEALAVGINLALRINPKARPRSIDWLESPEFKKHVTSDASNSAPKMRGRVEFVRDRWLEGV